MPEQRENSAGTEKNEKRSRPRIKKEPEVVMHFVHPDGFDPNHSIYKACCCHTKTCTIVMGIFEIFAICFLLVAVLPDITTRVCEKLSNETDIIDLIQQFESENLKNSTYVSRYFCNHNIFYLVWAVAQITSINLMFYGIKTIRYWMFFPHFILRLVCLAIIVSIEIWVIYLASGQVADLAPYLLTIFTFLVILLIFLYATWVEIRCAHFIKRSRDTGFSISVARPVGPATISLTDPVPNPEPQNRRLPTIGKRKTNQYIVNDPEPPKMSNPNETQT